MASAAYGRLVSADDEHARYEYGTGPDDPRGACSSSWCVAGAGFDLHGMSSAARATSHDGRVPLE